MTHHISTQLQADATNSDRSSTPTAVERCTDVKEPQCATHVIAAEQSSDDVIANGEAGATAVVASTPDEQESARPPDSLTRRRDALHLKRGFSRASINFQIVNQARHLVVRDVASGEENDQHQRSFVENSTTTFALPDLTRYPEGLKAFLYKDLIEMSTLVSLEQGGHLNWWADIGVGPRLYPMVTCGDGNCLLHAASLAMWGFHDRQLTLRKLLYESMLSGPARDSFKRRWRWQQTLIHKQCGLVFTEEEWEQEWQLVVKLAGPTPKIDGTLLGRSATAAPRSCAAAGQSGVCSEVTFESLEEIHVFILAHVLRRPIVVVSKTMLIGSLGEALAVIPFGGVYLPLELPPSESHRTPIMLTYDAAHFCALLAMNDELTTDVGELTIPLVGNDLEPLPVHFAVDPGSDFDWSQLEDIQCSPETDPAKQSSSRSAPIPVDRAELLNRYMYVRPVTVCCQKQTDDVVASATDSTSLSALTDPQAKPRPGSWSGRRHERVIPRVSSASSGFDNISNSADGAVDPGGTMGKNANDTKRTGTGGGSLPRGLPSVLRTFGSLGQNVSKTLRKWATAGGGGQSNKVKKRSVGTATQSSLATLTALERLIPGSEVTCAVIVRNRVLFEDQLVRNYLDSAAKRFEELQELRRLQCQELQHRLLSPPNSLPSSSAYSAVASADSQLVETSPSQQMSTVFNRQNTLLLAGRSKFYTLSHEQQCADPPISDDATASRPSSASARRRGHVVSADSQNSALKSSLSSTMVASSASSSPANKSRVPSSGIGGYYSNNIGSGIQSNSTSAAAAAFLEPERVISDNNNNNTNKRRNDGVKAETLSCRTRDGDVANVVCNKHSDRSNGECLCAQCVDANDFAQSFSRTVGYQTAQTKL